MRVDQVDNSSNGAGSTSKPAKKKVIHNVVILDASSSMQEDDKYNHAVAGIKKEMDELQAVNEVDYTQTVIELTTEFKGNRFNHGNRLPLTTYRFTGKGANGWTPLYEVVGETIEEFRDSKLKDDVVLLKIFTDGQENRSKGKYAGWHGGKLLAQLIEDVKKHHNFTVVFVGTKNDTEFMVQKMNMDRGDTLIHNNTGAGVEEALGFMAMSSVSYAKGISRGETTESLRGKFFKNKE